MTEPVWAGRHWTDAEKLDKLCAIVAPVSDRGVIDQREADGPTPVRRLLQPLL